MKYKLNNLHVLIFLHVVCFYFACYSSILGEVRAIFKLSRGGGGGGGMKIYGGWQIFRIQGGCRGANPDFSLGGGGIIGQILLKFAISRV